MYLGSWYGMRQGGGSGDDPDEFPEEAKMVMPPEIKQTGSAPVGIYPYIHAHKFPIHQKMWVRVAGGGTPDDDGFLQGEDNHVYEIALHDMRIMIKTVNEESGNSERQETATSVHILTQKEDHNIILEARKGKIALRARDIELKARDIWEDYDPENPHQDKLLEGTSDYVSEINMQAGTFNAETGEPEQDGNIYSIASQYGYTWAVLQNRFMAGTKLTDGEIVGLAKTAYGFEDHQPS